MIYSRVPEFISDQQQWALGYGLKKFLFNRSLTPGINHFRFISLGIDWLHINHQKNKITKELSLLSRLNIAVGSRVHPKNKNIFFFAALAYNIYKSRSGQTIETVFTKSGTEKIEGFQKWPGFSGGILIQ